MQKVKKLLEKTKKIAIFGHVHPDGDCLGSMLGLGALLEKQGKKVSYFTPTQPSGLFGFLRAIKKIKTNFDYGTYDLIIFVDFSAYRRIEEFTTGHEKYFDTHPLFVIDHHPGDECVHALMIKDSGSMSTAELIFEYTYKRWPKLFDAQIASYLYMGLTMDSGNFLYDEDHERVLSNALQLVKLGADKGLIVDQLIRKKSLNVIKFTQLLLARVEQKGDVLYSYYDDNDLKKYSVDEEEANYPLTIIQNIDGPKVVMIFKRRIDKVRVSLRSKKVKGKVTDCNTLARAFGGGGHTPAAGFTVIAKGNFEDQVKKIVNQIVKMM